MSAPDRMDVRPAAVGRTAGIVLTLALVGCLAAAAWAETGYTETDRVGIAWRNAPSLEDYMREYRELASRPEDARLTGVAAPVGPWYSVGPVGDLPTFDNSGLRNPGRIRSIEAWSNGANSYLYVGASSGGLWRSGLGSPVWTQVGANLPNPAVGAFAVDPANPDRIIVGTGDYTRYPGAGMFRTTDGGATWDAVPVPGNPGLYFKLFYRPQNPSTLVAQSSNGVMRSIDGGSTWLNVLPGEGHDLVLHPTSPDTMYATGKYRTDPPGTFALKWGSSGSQNNQFLGPYGLTTDPSGNVYVADNGNHRVLKFTANGTYISQLGGFGSGNGQFANPFDVAVDASGNIYVADYNNHRIQKFTSAGAFVAKWGSQGIGAGQFANPDGVAVDGSGNVYVSDYNNHRIQKFTSTGTFVATWGNLGTGPGQFNGPAGIAVDATGYVYVADRFNHRVQKFTNGGVFVKAWGTNGSNDGQFVNPYGLDVDTGGHLFVADIGNRRVQKFSTEGTFLTRWGSFGGGDGQFDSPYGIAVNSAGEVYVSESPNDRVQKFAMPSGEAWVGCVFRSADGGASWTPLGTGTWPNVYDPYRTVLAICAGRPTTLAVLLLNKDAAPRGVYLTRDAGAHWAQIGGETPYDYCDPMHHAISIAIRPTDPEWIIIGGAGMAQTIDGGATWMNNADPGPPRFTGGHMDVTQMYFSPVTGDNVMWICNDGGIFRYVFGDAAPTAWNGDFATGLRTTQIYWMDAKRDIRVVGSQDNGPIRSTDAGAHWTTIGGGDGYGCTIVDDLNNVLWHNVNGGNYRMWGDVVEHAPDVATGMSNLTSEPYGPWVFSGADNGTLYRTPALGPIGWSPIAQLPLQATGHHDAFAAPVDGRRVYLCSFDPVVNTCTDNGGAFSCVTTSLADSGITGVYPMCYAGSTEFPEESWVGLRGGPGKPKLLHTKDSWATFENLTGGLGSVGEVRAIAVVPFDHRQIYVATDLTVYYTPDSGESWTTFNTGLPIVWMTDIQYVVDRTRASTDRLLVATFGHGVWERQVQGTPTVWVSGAYAGTEEGSYEHPYDTFDEGLTATPNGGQLGLRGGDFDIPARTIARPITLRAFGGTPARLH